MSRLWMCLVSPPVLAVLMICVTLSVAAEDCANVNTTLNEECQCSRRLRLEDSSGVIVDHFGTENYDDDLRCLFFLESDRPIASIRLRFNYFHVECLWDYLYIFEGDSIYSTKIAALSGDILPQESESDNMPDITPIPVVEQNGTNSTNITGSGMGMGSEEVLIPYQEDPEITITSPGPILLLYFFSDRNVAKPGFNVSYWVNYTCPENCSGHGVCSEEGRCECGEGWRGEVCQLLACPNNCSGNGVCSSEGDKCECEDGYTGVGCAITSSSPHWETVNYATTGNLTESLLARASHSAVLWGDYMIVYGGYRFPVQEEGEGGGGSGGGEGDEGERETVMEPQLLQYHIATATWEELEVNLSAPHPAPRYGHSAVVYNDTMYVFGGVLTPQEEITSEFWALDLTSLTWTDLTVHTDIMNSSSANITETDADVAITTTNEASVSAPLPVRGHTAHVVGGKMVVLCGMTASQDNHLLSLAQEYDFGRPANGPSSAYLHSAALLWNSLMIMFGGFSGEECFSDQLLVYNIACDKWYEVSYPGLPGNSRRYGHTSLLDSTHNTMLVFGGFLGQPYSDMLQLTTGNCSQFVSEEECVSGSVFCGWSNSSDSCLSLGATGYSSTSSLDLACYVDACLSLSCEDCLGELNCTWSDTENVCRNGTANVNATCPSSSPSTDDCGWFNNTCEGCQAHGCQWAEVDGQDACLSPDFDASNFTSKECGVPCSSFTTCSDCPSSCLWCPSLGQCFDRVGMAYAYTYPFGQCLGWSYPDDECPPSCSSLKSCDSCHQQPGCGWCRGPEDTGLGVCMEGGFLTPREPSSCPSFLWYFDECPACQCNGHSMCVNESVCEMCEDNTAGENCQYCADGYFGNAIAGGNCTECFCNDYASDCNRNTGVCSCHDVGVVGNHCDKCAINNSYEGDADNICYYEMSVGFIYTFGVTEDRERESFYLAVPGDDTSLKFEFDIRFNPNRQEVKVQLFLGRRSENYWVLANLTDPITVRGTGSFSRELDDRSGNKNASESQLFSFAQPSLRNTPNFTKLFISRTEHDYTNNMWNGDVALIIHVSNLTHPLSFKMTLDQTNLWFLLYFFATFIIVFTALLTFFMIGWYLKRKIEVRRYMRQQYRELRRRVSRPFARVKLIIQDRVRLSPSSPQQAAYVSVQSCKSTKAGILTTFIQLPGDSRTGRPAPGRTGLCLGTALVKVSHSKKSKDRTKGKERSGRSQEREEVVVQGDGVPRGSVGESNGTLRERRAERSGPNPPASDPTSPQ